MGLDMYLKGKRYLSKYRDDSDVPKQEAIQAMFPELKGHTNQWDESLVEEVTISAGYWRKANAVHDWFVKTVQEGTDDCKSYYVAREQLEELRKICRQILDNQELASELLPTTSGFFFGSTDYDEWYFTDIERTVNICNFCLSLPLEWSFEYQSSW